MKLLLGENVGVPAIQLNKGGEGIGSSHALKIALPSVLFLAPPSHTCSEAAQPEMSGWSRVNPPRVAVGSLQPLFRPGVRTDISFNCLE